MKIYFHYNLKSCLFLFIFLVSIGIYLGINGLSLSTNIFNADAFKYFNNNNNFSSSCSIFNKNFVHYTVKIDNQTYPKYINLYENKSVDFQCLNKDTDIKIILLWNSYFRRADYYYGLGKIKPFEKRNCPITKCELTNDKRKLNKSHYVITHMGNSLDGLPKHRPEYQRWIFLLFESPINSNNFNSNPILANFYNLTSTYKINSDFPNFYEGYAQMVWEYNANFNETKNFSAEKVEFAAAIISNCDASHRLNYIKELQNYIKVDIFGKCGRKCPIMSKVNPKIVDDCKQIISTDYKFYFSFENSICKDYITEKFFSILRYNVIPVVYGGGLYEHYIPKSGFISVHDYKKPKDLANYLQYLNSNSTAYNSYFKWKKHVKFDDKIRHFNNILCNMCIQLHLENYSGVKNSIVDLKAYWNSKNDCI